VRVFLFLASQYRQFISISLLLLSGVSFAAPRAYPFLKFKDHWVTASDENVLNARCSRKIPFTDREMRDWLVQKARDDSQRVSVHVHGIELIDESLYLADLLRALLTKDAGSAQPQRIFESGCKNVFCAANEVFGKRVGLQLLFMLGRFGFNGSHLRVDDASIWTSQELDTILLSLSDLPQELIPASPLIFNRQLVHNRRGKLNPGNDDSLASTIESGIRIFDPWNEYSFAMQRYTLYHEVGHVFGYESGLHSTARWSQYHDQAAISKYAESRPIESFAESFAAYRYNPDWFKKSAPGVYDFVKTEVFKNIEYTNDQACQIMHPESPDAIVALDRLKRSIPIDSESLSSMTLSDEEIEQTRQECLSGSRLISSFASGKLLQASARCVHEMEFKKAVESALNQSIELKGLNAEWVSHVLYMPLDQQTLSEKNSQMKCDTQCKKLTQEGLNQIEHVMKLVFEDSIDLRNERDKQSVQKFCSDLSIANTQAIQGYTEVQELIGENGMDDLVDASIQVCKVIQSKFKKRQTFDAGRIDAALKEIYPVLK
jgi:hypothetical protein